MKTRKRKVILISVASIVVCTFLLYAALLTVARAYDNRVAEITEQDAADYSRRFPLTVNELYRLVNEERSKQHLPSLQLDQRLNQSAQIKADDMRNEGYYDHVNPRTGKRGYTLVYDTSGALCYGAGENLVGATASKMAVDKWMASPPHRAAILDVDNELVGFGINGDYVVQHFCNINN